MISSDQSQFDALKEKWTKRHQQLTTKLLKKHKDSVNWLMENAPAKHHLASASLSGLLLLASPMRDALPLPSLQLPKKVETPTVGKQVFVIADLAKVLPRDVRPLTKEEEEQVSQVFSRYLPYKVQVEIDGKRLNRSYGLIGVEQHLARFPGDTMQSHFATQDEAEQFYSSGMAPGLGAWGYFVPSGQQMTEKDILFEKYYLAVQTFLAPDFYNKISEYRDFFKFRKMLVVNPQNGRAVVAVIGDSGPAEWTGKHLGGSPEVMAYLKRVDGRQRGAVLYFFIDDPNDTVPLGPVSYTE